MRWPNFGVHALVVAAGGLLTGVFLALNFAPTLAAARDSVAYIESDVVLGRFLRGLHHWAGNFAIVLAALHGGRVFWRGAYKAPRRALWVLGCLIFLVLVGFAYTGYLLPGDERAFAAMGVMQEISGSTPVVGGQISRVMVGAAWISSATLTRVYVVHTMLLPVALIALVAASLLVARRGGQPVLLQGETGPGLAVLVLLGVCAWLFPPALGAAPDFAGAGSPDAKPEWFLLWVNEALRIVPGMTFLIGGLMPQVFVLLAIALPWLARGEAREPAQRKPELLVALVILLLIGGLTVSSLASTRPAEEEEEEPAAAATDDLEEHVAAAMKRFQCRKCHVIDGDEEGGDSGPALSRQATADLPAFRDLYTRRYFRLKIADPAKFWPETGMTYRKRAGLPSEEQLDVLERWFFD